MQLLVLILKKIEFQAEIMKELAEAGVKGGTVLEGTGMAKTLANLEDIPIVGMLRRVLSDEENEICKVMLFVLKDEQAITTRTTIKRIIGDFNAPNTGIMFSIPITYVEGLGE
jgi:putative N-acetylmannosamine-6-phosphate epimerase